MNDMPLIEIRELKDKNLATHLPSLAQLLHACVEAGASVSFVMPFSMTQAEAFWTRKVAPALAEGRRVLFLALLSERVVGSVQLDLDMPPNQQHRAVVSKLLVHPDFRRQGIARLVHMSFALVAHLKRIKARIHIAA